LEEQDIDFDGLVIKVCDIPNDSDNSKDLGLFSESLPQNDKKSIREIL
jgi:hypothetical protein